MVNVKDVVSVMIPSGDEFVGEVVSIEGSSVTLKNARIVITDPKGGDSLGLANQTCVTGDKESDAQFYNVCLIQKTNDNVTEIWKSIVETETN